LRTRCTFTKREREREKEKEKAKAKERGIIVCIMNLCLLGKILGFGNLRFIAWVSAGRSWDRSGR
jgi:hypothetical protein